MLDNKSEPVENPSNDLLEEFENGEPPTSSSMQHEQKEKKNEYNKTDDIEKQLWTMAKKYKTLFDQGTIPQIAESERDRMEVSEAYLELETSRHRQLDSRVYQSFTKMQRTRDSKIALEGTTEKDRLRMIAWEVKIRTQAVLFTLGDSTLEMDIFNLHNGNSARVLDGDEKELEIEDAIILDKGLAILDALPVRTITPEQKETLKAEFITKYVGKKYHKADFESELDNINADLLSLLVREKKIVIIKREIGLIEILTYDTFLAELDKEQLINNQSLIIFPRKKTITWGTKND